MMNIVDPFYEWVTDSDPSPMLLRHSCLGLEGFSLYLKQGRAGPVNGSVCRLSEITCVWTGL